MYKFNSFHCLEVMSRADDHPVI